MASKKNIDNILKKIGEEIIAGFQDEIRSAGKVSTGKLLNSFNADVDDGNLIITSDVDYAGAVDEGRGPTRNSGPNLQSALEQWIKGKGLTIRTFGTKRGGRFIKRTDNAVKGVAFIMARKIHNGGYGEKFGVAEFSSKTMNRMMDTITQQLGEEYFNYISEEIRENIINRLREE
jgi:hypothetical protein